MNEAQLTLYHLAVALAIGLLIGIERGWKDRDASEGERVAGVRTYGLIGLLGGISAILGTLFGTVVTGLLFLGVAAVLATAYRTNQRDSSDVGVTSLIASLMTFVLGALAARGELAVAAAAAVVTTLLLHQKPLLHRWVKALEPKELRAGIELLLISVVLLPVLPDQGYGPWQVLNPYEIWWMVVLIASISFIGYFAIKIGGARKGAVFTGLFGGLAASTAVTLHFSRLARREPVMGSALSTGILLACGTMLPRMLLIAGLLNVTLLVPLLLPAVLMALITYVPALVYLREQSAMPSHLSSPMKNPLELRSALLFGAFLVLVLLLGKTLQYGFGDTGVLVLSAASGVTDVDAIALSLARMSNDDLAIPVAVTGLVIAAAVNNLAKAAMAVLIGGRGIAFRVGLPLVASAIAGLLAVLWA